MNRSRKAVALTALAAAVALTATACGGGGSNNKSSSNQGAGYDAATKGKVINASDKKGGTLKLMSPQDVDFLDPARAYYGFVWNMQRLYIRQLLAYDSKPGEAGTKLVPDLAESLPTLSNGGKTYTFKLKAGVKFEDGTPITSKDIKYGIERVFAQDVLSGGPTYLIDLLDQGQKYPGPYKDKDPNKLGLKSVQTPDDQTIVFNLAKPNSDFSYLMAMADSSPVPAAKDDGAKYTNHPVATGPYKVQSFVAGKETVFVRNPNWDSKTDPIRKGLPDKVTFTVTSNPDDMDARLLSGDVDYAVDGTGVQQAAKIKILQTPKYKANADDPFSGYIRYFAFPQTVAPFDNIECRKAVIYAADPKSLQTARGGPTSGDLGANMLPPGIPGSDKSYDPWGLTQGKPQLDKAKAALKACGKPNGFKTTIAVRNNRKPEIATAESLQASLKAVGIDASIDQYDGKNSSSVIGAPDNVKKKGYGIIVMGWGADYNSGAGFLQPLVDGSFILKNGNNNYTMLNDKTVNGLFDQAAAAASPEAAAPFYTQINKAIMEKALYLPINFDKALVYRNPRLTNVFYQESMGRLDLAVMGVVK
ncbi:ABC transporter substrate-binding protein [Streptomyces sp. NBC_00841]|uniref:ABC transporter substrate-binding protein n=1 Tax=unclassified Streptomyces TaxID=2593676 RepID=UPI00224CF2BB|nr:MULTISPECIES: ABC transporter substrate-binding protein [unclassified Streptomyces]MCX4532488.1 ABC transporter substrate-binding protein [Streptomyces sp. NBC_01669]WSA02025.1 ABC transporter substrate-binding protein [Streptomyces sp. NBC_00841]